MSAPSQTAYRSLAAAASEVGRRRADQVRQMRAALLRGDEAEALRLLRIYAGLQREREERECPPAN